MASSDDDEELLTTQFPEYPHEGDRSSKWRDRMSMRTIMLIVFVGDMQRGILFPTLWPYIKLLGGDRITQGFVIAAFSMGRFISSPLMGKLSATEGYQLVLAVSLAIMVAGSLLYAISSGLWMLVCSQLLMGFGSGTLGVTRAYVAANSLRKDRTYMLAKLTAFQYAGFTCTPFIGAALCSLFQTTDIEIDPDGCQLLRWDLNKYTAPAWCMAFMGIIAITLLCTVFVNSIPSPKRAEKAALRGTPLNTPIKTRAKHIPKNYETIEGDFTKENVEAEKDDHEFRAAIYGGFLGNIMTKGSIASPCLAGAFHVYMECSITDIPLLSGYETLAIQYAMSSFNLLSTEAGYLVACFGAVGVISLFSMRWFLKLANDADLIIGGVTVMCASAIILSLAPLVRPYWGMGGAFFFVSMFMMYSVGYPIGHTTLIGLFSKVIGKKPQGEMMGWFGSCGSLSRIIFPICAGIISQEMGTHTLFAIVGGLLAIVAIVACFLRQKYLPYV